MQNGGTGCPRVISMQNVYYKLVFRPSGFVSEFYDLQKDPMEESNLWWSQDAEVQAVKSAMLFNLTSWLVETSDVVPILLDPRQLPPQAPV